MTFISFIFHVLFLIIVILFSNAYYFAIKEINDLKIKNYDLEKELFDLKNKK